MGFNIPGLASILPNQGRIARCRIPLEGLSFGSVVVSGIWKGGINYNSSNALRN